MEQVGWSPSPIVDTYPGAGRDYGKGRHILQEVDAQDMYPQERAKCLYYPFKNEDDFDMGAWLMESGASMAHIDSFLKLPIASVSSYFLVLTTHGCVIDCAHESNFIQECPGSSHKGGEAPKTAGVEITYRNRGRWHHERTHGVFVS